MVTENSTTVEEWQTDMTRCLKEYVRAQAEHARMEAEAKKAKAHLNEVIAVASRLMEDCDVDSINITNPDTGEKRLVFRHHIQKVGTKAGIANTQELFDALRNNDLAGLIKDGVNAKSLESALKERYRDDTGAIVLPPDLDGLINVFEEFTVRSRKG